MGQMRDDSLEQLLLLGEPEAVVAAVCAAGLTDELARRAWWAMEDAANARHMLGKCAVVNGRMGPLLAAYLVEHLPFESEPEQQIETVRWCCRKGLLTAEQVEGLWRKAQRKPAYYVGFLAARAMTCPNPQPHPLACGTGCAPELLPTATAGRLGSKAGDVARRAGIHRDGVRVFDKPPTRKWSIWRSTRSRRTCRGTPAGPVDATLDELQRRSRRLGGAIDDVKICRNYGNRYQ